MRCNRCLRERRPARTYVVKTMLDAVVAWQLSADIAADNQWTFNGLTVLLAKTSLDWLLPKASSFLELLATPAAPQPFRDEYRDQRLD
ncbi:hypothetical protein BIW11_08519 [Tropilaelaps mercedesae]|uniref:Uncharacterized protein n=1 Tax=Tropilaelaps mercedesae TaxID=418985 RepID=A0A1V9XPL7_9ACAR|nr:hypothetical protein BIW11_08519 [Tropilaelaps mercedesae]